MNDILTVSFSSSLEDKAALCVSRKIGDQITVLKMELGEQADILYRLLTEQTTKAVVIKEEKEISYTPKEVRNILIEEGQTHGRKYGFKLGCTIKFSPVEVEEILKSESEVEE